MPPFSCIDFSYCASQVGTALSRSDIATGAALAQEEALQITANNVANANTAGFTRKTPVLQSEPGYFNGQFTVDRGVTLTGSQSLRDRVLELLTRAKETLGRKYGVQLTQPTTVEIFPEQKDFAVRTFGMPGNPGYLGVCFGSVS